MNKALIHLFFLFNIGLFLYLAVQASIANDGINDIVVTNYDDNTLTILLSK